MTRKPMFLPSENIVLDKLLEFSMLAIGSIFLLEVELIEA